MSLKLWKYLKGYVIIRVSGFSVERFINLAMNRNIYMSDVVYKDNFVTMKVSIEGFKLLKPIIKKTKCRVEIIEKVGVPFFIFKYRKRKLLAIGTVFFLFSIYILSTHIWLIEINGLDRIYYDDINNFIKSEGLYVSAKRKDIDTEAISEDIINNFPEIAWININLKGTKATLSIKETIEKKEIPTKDVPSNIVAKKDGIIEKIVVSNGVAVVKPFDVVKEGDVLISGELKVKEDEFGVLKSYVKSKGEVLAKTYYNFSFTVPYEYEEKIPTGREINDYRYSVFNKKISLLNRKIGFENYNRVSLYNELNLGDDYPLPFIIIKDTYKELESIKKTRTKEEATNMAYIITDNRILRELSFNINIVDKKVELKENSKGIEVIVNIDAIEDISKEVEIDMSSIEYDKTIQDNMEDETNSIN